LHASRGDRDRAIADYGRAIELASAGQKFEHVLALGSRADIYREQGKSALALADYDKAVAVAATDSMYNYILGPDVLLGRSRLHLAAGKPDAARADLQAALKLNPKHDAVKAELAKLEPQAAATSQGAPTPETAEEWLKLAMRQGRQKDADGAIASLTKCLELKADMLPCLVFRGNAQAVKGLYDSASADYAKAIALDPNHPAPYAGRGIMLAKQGKRDEAIRDLRTALRLKPDFNDAKQALQRLGVEP
jgi:tetratricopeptide (TPR) repeat protein